MRNKAAAGQSSQFERLANVVALPIGRWDRDARLIFLQYPYLAWSGRRQEELLGGTLESLYGADAWQAARPAFERAFQGEPSSYERLLTHAPHPERWVRIQVFPEAGTDGAVASVFTIATDIHQDVVQRDALIAARKRLDRFTDNIPMPLVYLDVDCRLRFVNRAWREMVGAVGDNALGRHVSEVRGEAIWLEQKPYYDKALAGEPSHFSRLVRGIVGGPRWMRTSYYPDFDDGGNVVGIYTLSTDVHELTSTQERLRRSLERDALTDALSRQTMMSYIEYSLADPKHEYALFFIDLDGFKAVNDQQGHHAGDRLLATIAASLRDAVRAEDAVGRFGGDEFLVLARGCGHAAAPAFAEKLRAAVAAAAASSGTSVSASVGYAIAPTDTRDPVALLQFADSAMYAAKYSGKNRVMPPARPEPPANA